MTLDHDKELAPWIYGLLHGEPNRSGDFLRSLAEAASRADVDNYRLLRPALLTLKAKYPAYRCSCLLTDQLVFGENVLAVCIPCELAPNFPATASYSQWVTIDCPDCGRKMWLGERVKALLDAGAVRIACAVCAIEKHGVNSAERMTLLTKEAS